MFLAVRSGQDPIALKVFHPQWSADLDFCRELFADAERVKRYEHPVVVRLHGVGHEGPALVMASQLVAGQPLGSVLRKARVDDRPLRQPVFAALMSQLCDALRLAHAFGASDGLPLVFGRLALRDVMLDYDGRLRLCGMGSGRALRRVPPSPRRLPYQAPEVLRGREPTPKTDVFSFAAILYEGFLGRSAYRHPSSDDTRKAVLHADFAPIKPTHLEVKPGIADWIMAALVPRPEARPDLETVQALLTSSADPEGLTSLPARMSELFSSEAESFARMQAALVGDRVKTHWATPEELALEAHDKGSAASALSDAPTAAVDAGFGPEATLPTVERDSSPAPDPQPVPLVHSTEPAVHDSAARNDRQVSRYRLSRLVMSDGPIEEFEAYDPNLGRNVHLRLLTPSRAEPPLGPAEHVRLFKRESRLAAVFRHPSFPRLFDAGRSDERYFAVYEARDGQGLAEVLSEGVELDGTTVLRELTSMVDALHTRGVVLGELRPSAVRVSPAGKPELVRLARSFAAHQDIHPLLSPDSAWAPPEFRERRAWGYRGDQFVIGLLVVRIVTGRSPTWVFERDISPDELRQAGASLPDEVSEVLCRMLRLNPDQRFSHLGEVLIATGEEASPSASSRPHHPDADLVRVMAELCHRASGLSAGKSSQRQVQDPALIAAALARRSGLSAEVARRVMILAALRALARRTRVAVLGPEFRSLVPVAVRDLARELSAPPRPTGSFVADDQWTGDLSRFSPDQDSTEHEVEIVRLAEAFTESRLHDKRGVEAQLLSLRAHFSPQLVDALHEHLSELLDRGERRVSGRVLLGGSGLRFFGDAMDELGFEVVRTEDGHQAWEVLRGQGLRAAVLSDGLSGRDGLSLIQLCRAHPNLTALPIWMVSEVMDETVRRKVTSLQAIPVEGPDRFERLVSSMAELLVGV